MVWSREESIVGHHKRHPMTIRCRWGATRDGRITAVEAEVVADGGAYASTSVEVTKVAALFASGCYEVPNIAVDGYAVYTNNVPSGAFRGFGAPQAQFAAEIMVTRLAHALGMDPVEMRRRNIYREGSLEPTQQPLPPGVSMREVLERCVEEIRGRRTRWQMAGGQGDRRTRFCPALPLSPFRISPWGRHRLRHQERRLLVRLSRAGDGDGGVDRAVRGGAAGHGPSRRGRCGAGDAPGAAPDRRRGAWVAVGAGRDGHRRQSEAPNAGSASASRLTLMAGRAVAEAAAKALAEWRDTEEEQVVATVQFRPPATTPLDEATGAGFPNYCYGYAAQAVEVEVNLLTGQVQVLRIISVHDVGKAINRQQVEGQIEGCLAQAIGYALLEDFRIEDGRVLTRYFSTYLLPTALDMPTEIVPVISGTGRSQWALRRPRRRGDAAGAVRSRRRRRHPRCDRRLGDAPAHDAGAGADGADGGAGLNAAP